jgi:GTP-binding protein
MQTSNLLHTLFPYLDPSFSSKEIKFLGAATTAQNMQIFSTPEVAFLGKSNVGKSTLINRLCGRKALARVSKTPGCTRQINFFGIGEQLILADLPGYGYAKVSGTMSRQWEKLIIHYLTKRQNLSKIMLLIDARRGLKDHDLQIVDMLLYYGRTFDVVFTKGDQISSQAKAELLSQSHQQLISTGAKLMMVVY